MSNDEIGKLLNRIETMLINIQNMPAKTYLKTKEACQYLSVSQNTLTKICGEYGINPKKIGGCLYYPVQDLNRLFEQN